MNYANGEIYIGAWKNHQKWGKGKFVDMEGNIYEGNFAKNHK